MLMEKPLSVDLQNTIIMVFHTILLLTKEFASQIDKCNSGPMIIESTGLTMLLTVLKQLPLYKAVGFFYDTVPQLGGSSLEEWDRVLQKVIYFLNQHPGYGAVSPQPKSTDQGVERRMVPLTITPSDRPSSFYFLFL